MNLRKTYAALAAFGLALGLGACERTDPNGPAALVEQLYQPYLTQGDTAQALDNAPLSASLRALVDKAVAYGNLLNEPVLDFDPIIFAQEGEISDVRAQMRGSGDGAVVQASFKSFGEPQIVLYDMKRENDAWVIDNIRSGEDGLRAIIEDGLKPTGDPAAMIAPVKGVYDTYAEPSQGAPAEPLAGYAAVSATFRPLLEKRQSLIRSGEADPLGFDPVVDATAWQLADVKFEAASSAVIARFTNGGAPKAIVYDLIEENGAWAIDDIRAPGVWDVRMKLNDAGIK